MEDNGNFTPIWVSALHHIPFRLSCGVLLEFFTDGKILSRKSHLTPVLTIFSHVRYHLNFPMLSALLYVVS
jgi:hypothetical protein